MHLCQQAQTAVTFDLPVRKDALIRWFRFANLRLGDI